MRALLCLPLYPPAVGGSAALFADLVRVWEQDGGEAVVYTTHPHPDLAPVLDPAAAPPGRVRRFGALPAAAPAWRGRLLAAASRGGPRRWRAAVGFPHVLTRGYRRFLRRAARATDGPFDLVVGGALPHTHFLEPAVRFASRQRIPLIVVPLLHAGLLGTRPGRQVWGPGAAPLLCRAARVVALTAAEVAPLRAAGVVAERLRVLPAALWRAEPPGGDRGGPAAAEPYVLQAGALARDKGTLVLLQAYRLLRGGGVPAGLVLAGHLQEEVRRALAELPEALRRAVTVREDPPAGEWHRLLAGAAVLAHPSRADAFGRVILEAWRAGAPVVVADAGGPAELVRGEIDGLLVPPEHPEALAAALRRLLEDPDAARRLGSAGQRRFRETYTWDRVGPAWMQLFAEVMAGAEGARRRDRHAIHAAGGP